MDKRIYEIIDARMAKEKTFYIFEGIVYQYGKVKNLQYKDRFFRVCKADNVKTKLDDDLKDGWTLVNLDVRPIDIEKSIIDMGSTTFDIKIK